MIFASNIFLFIFLPIFLLIYYAVGKNWRSHVIVLGSYTFYAWWRPDFLLLFVGITYWNYLFGLKIYALRDTHRKQAFRWLTIGVIGNLATLGYFKYANFGAEVLADAMVQAGLNPFTLEHIILPLGISFYVFQALSYIVDIYRKEADPTNSFMDFAAFIALFPQLVAGPILRYQLIEQQLRQRTHSWELFSLGVSRFMLGFVKKVLIADSIAPINTYIMSTPDPMMIETWIGCALSLIQLYFDFSGYSDMAIGLGLMMGFKFAENFNQPFLCMSLTEFWRRWHLTLSEFLKDYIYISIAKTGLVTAGFALFLTMALSGLWHGPSFSYIFFGVYFGVIMVIEKKFGWATDVTSRYSFARNMFTFALLVIDTPFFIGGNLQQSMVLLSGLFGFNGVGGVDSLVIGTSVMTMFFMFVAIVWLAVAGIINRRFYTLKQESYVMSDVSHWESMLLWGAFAIALSKLSAGSFSPFLYFQF